MKARGREGEEGRAGEERRGGCEGGCCRVQEASLRSNTQTQRVFPHNTSAALSITDTNDTSMHIYKIDMKREQKLELH